MPLQNIKSYIEIQQLDQITNFREADGERIVRAFYFTTELGRLAAKLIEAVASPRSGNSARIVTGARGVGKSHFLAFIQAITTTPRTRLLLSGNPQVANAARRLEGTGYVLINVTAPPAGGHFDFFKALREGLRRTPGNPIEFDDTQWFMAAEHEQIWELICSKLFPGMALLVSMDDISEVFRSGKRDVVQATLARLSALAAKSRELPIVVLLALDNDVLDAQSGQAARLAADYQIDTLAIDNLRRITDQAIFKKNANQRAELSALYREALRFLPNFRWSEAEFVELYPVHPAVLDVAPGMSAFCESFSLFGFMNASAGRALGRRPLQLISLDELFDRFEFDLRKDERLKRGLEVYDFLSTMIIPGLQMGDRFKAKLILKAVFLFSMVERDVSAYDLTDTLMLYEERSPESGYAQVASILSRLESQAEGHLIGDGENKDRRYRIVVIEKFDPEARLNAAVKEIPNDDPRLGALLVAQGGICFHEWPFSSEALLMANAVQQRTELSLPWRGTLRKGLVVYNNPVELAALPAVRIERHEDRPTPESLPEATRTPDGVPIPSPSSSLPELTGPETKITFTYHWSEEGCEYDWQLSVLPAGNPNPPADFPEIGSLLFWVPRQIDSAGLTVLKKAWVVYTQGEDVLGVSVADRLEQIESQIRALFFQLYVEQGALVSASGERFAAKELWGEGTTFKRFGEFVGALVQPMLDRRYPLHPQFKAVLTEREVRRLVLGLMGGLNPSDPGVQEYARQYGMPLRIVAERDGLIQLAVDRDEALSQPFISEVLRLVEAGSSGDPVPVQVIYQTLRREPYGLLEPVQQLILMALIAGWRIELIDVSGLRVFGAAELTQDVSFRQYGTVRRTATISYSADALSEWCRLLTERTDLPDLTETQGRKLMREALAVWYVKWAEYDLAARFDALPVEMLTTRTWQLIITCKRYFETTANAVEAVLHERISLEMGLARVVEVFSANQTLFLKARQELQLLVEFLNWIPFYVGAKNYTLTAVHFNNDEITGIRRELTHFFEHPHRLLDEDKRRRFENIFKNFRDRFSTFYAARHDDAMSNLADLDPLHAFLSGTPWRTFELISQLNISNRRYMILAQEILRKVRDSHCPLPVKEILTVQPYCACGYRLDQTLSVGSMVDELKLVVKQGIDYHRRLFIQYRSKLTQALRALGSSPSAANKDQALALLTFIGSGEAALEMNLTPGMIELVNECLKDEFHVLPASPPSPFVLGEHLTKQELKAKLNAWIDGLPDDPSFAFEMAEAPLAGE